MLMLQYRREVDGVTSTQVIGRGHRVHGWRGSLEGQGHGEGWKTTVNNYTMMKDYG